MDEFDIYFDEEDCDKGMALCECCSSYVYVGNAMSFVCPECDAEQNI